MSRVRRGSVAATKKMPPIKLEMPENSCVPAKSVLCWAFKIAPVIGKPVRQLQLR